MVMALSLFHKERRLTLVAGYENGHTVVVQLESDGAWTTTYQNQCHTQPVLSLDVSPDRAYFLTSGADDVIAKHPIPAISQAPEVVCSKKPSPIQEEPAIRSNSPDQTQTHPTKSLLSQQLAQVPSLPSPKTKTVIQTEPLKITHTRHSGQQDLKLRSDGKIFATAGWDAKVRVYSAKTLKEVAVLKWHQVGCYATAFADVQGTAVGESRPATDEKRTGSATDPDDKTGEQAQGDDATVTVVPKLVEVTLRDKRIGQAKTAHWLAVGSKDGKVSLWDVF
jgi:ASTRA-associated protein 1